MGPNGSGKSTLGHVLAGKPGYESPEARFCTTARTCRVAGRARRRGRVPGVPVSGGDPGVATMTFLRTALNAQRKKRGESELSTPDFLKLVREVAASLNIEDMLRRASMSASPAARRSATRFCRWRCSNRVVVSTKPIPVSISMRCAMVADGVNALRSPERALVVITHYQRLLNYIVPDQVHVMSKGRVVKSGGKELAMELEESGYAQFEAQAA